MTKQERSDKFQALWSRLPGRNIDKMRVIRDFLVVSPTTIRIWRMADTHRPIPESKLVMLQRHFSAQ